MSRWSSDPDAAARALLTGTLAEHEPVGPVLWAGAPPVPGRSGDAIPGALPAPLPAAVWNRRTTPAAAGMPEPPCGPFSTVLLRLPKSRGEQLMAVHQCLGVLTPTGQLWVYGGNDEGIRALEKTLQRDFGALGPIKPLATRGHGRVLAVQRSDITVPLRPRVADWRQSEPVGAANPDAAGAPWISYPGLFAGGSADPGTALLCTHLPAVVAALPAAPAVLDYGCGPGAISAELRRRVPTARLTLVDNDSVALLAAAENVPGAECIAGDRLAAVGPRRFDLIVSNPPLHAGFKDDTSALIRLVGDAPQHLTPRGLLLMVVQRRIALDQLLNATFATVTTPADDGRYRLWVATGRKGKGKGASPGRP